MYSVLRIVTRIQAGRSGVGIPVGARDFSLLQTDSAPHPASYSVGSKVLFRKQSGRGVKLTTHLRLAPRLRIGWVIHLSLFLP